MVIMKSLFEYCDNMRAIKVFINPQNYRWYEKRLLKLHKQESSILYYVLPINMYITHKRKTVQFNNGNSQNAFTGSNKCKCLSFASDQLYYFNSKCIHTNSCSYNNIYNNNFD